MSYKLHVGTKVLFSFRGCVECRNPSRSNTDGQCLRFVLPLLLLPSTYNSSIHCIHSSRSLLLFLCQFLKKISFSALFWHMEPQKPDNSYCYQKHRNTQKNNTSQSHTIGWSSLERNSHSLTHSVTFHFYRRHRGSLFNFCLEKNLRISRGEKILH